MFASKFVLVIIILIFPCMSFAGQPEGAANSMADMARGKFGSKDNIKQNIIAPMTSSNTPMQTVDGSKSFNAQLVCPSSKEFLHVFVQPSGTGDLSTVIVRQDTNFDGTSDYSYRVPVLVSGVCANGIISCAAGQWSSCKYFKWVSDSNAKVSLSESPLMELGGCYCINSSCGSNLVWSNLSIILKDIGGGIAGAIQTVNPKYAISDVKIENTTISYYGQSSGDCSANSGGFGSRNPQQYYSNWAQISADVETEKSTQAADPKSYYSMLSNSLAMQGITAEYNSCNIKRFLSCIPDSTDYMHNLNNNCSPLESDNKCKLKSEVVDGVSTYNNYNPTMLTPIETCKQITCQKEAVCNNDIIYSYGIPEMNCDTDITSPCLPNEVPSKKVCSDGSYPWGDQCENEQSPICIQTSPYSTYTTYVPAGNAITPSVSLYITSGRGRCLGNVYIGIWNQSGSLVAYTNRKSLGCGSHTIPLVYQAPVSGNYTVKIWVCDRAHYGGAGGSGNIRQIRCPLDPNLSCTGSVNGTSICVQSQTHTVCNWWQKDRTYMCQTKPWDFSDIQMRNAKIISTVKDNTASMYYQDLRKDKNNNWITEDKTIGGLGNRQSYDSCEKACKVRKPRADTQASYSGHTAQYRTNTQAFDFFYKPCPQGTCPVGVGEEIVKDCQCINEFGEAASVMQALRMAARDLICSSGASKEIK